MRRGGAGLCAPARQHPSQGRAGEFRSWQYQRWGGDLNASTHLLEGLHYCGLLRVARREAGTRVYQVIEQPPQEDSSQTRLARAGQLLDMVVKLYAPLPAASLGYLCGLLRHGVPHWPAKCANPAAGQVPICPCPDRRPAVVLAAGRETRVRPVPGRRGCASLRPLTP